MNQHTFDSIQNHWQRSGLTEAILAALTAAGKNLDALTLDDLAPFDQFHGGGKRLTQRLAHLAGLTTGLSVLDVGGGLGGPARTLAVEFGCRVKVIDLTEDYIEAGRALTVRLKLDQQVTFQLGNALDLPVEAESFDVIWTQNSGMNIEDKEKLYAGFQRVVRSGGLLVTQEIMLGPNPPPIFPVMWSRDGSHSYLHSPADLRSIIEAAGFQVRHWDDVTLERDTPAAVRPIETIQNLVMGAELLDAITKAAKRNEVEQRTLMIQAVCEKVPEILSTDARRLR